MYGFNDWQTVTVTALILFGVGIVAGLVGSKLFKNFPITRQTEKMAVSDEEAA